ncbi:hypothetical protein LCGC14_1635420 [marine sediment metagenome]|uniref:Uncharacterized protein n=1 Tax=marine sediment metagenome TaxID=412755 RepID=A0A0F9I1L5_9ZZZZ
MTNWKHTVQIKDLLSDEDASPAHAAELGRIVAQRLRKSPLMNRGMLALRFERVQDQDDFNKLMDHLYDDADRERVWIA